MLGSKAPTMIPLDCRSAKQSVSILVGKNQHYYKGEVMKDLEARYLERLSQLYPTIAKASTEIINLQSILNLPKGTEHFMSDIHGEYEA